MGRRLEVVRIGFVTRVGVRFGLGVDSNFGCWLVEGRIAAVIVVLSLLSCCQISF